MRYVSFLLLGLLPLAALALPRPARASDSEARRFALVIGSNEGGPERVTLRFAHTDASSVAGVLVDLGGVQPADEVVLFDPRRGQLISAFAALRQRMTASGSQRNEVLIYYSGHSDEEGLLLSGDHFGYDEFKAAMERLPAIVRVGILDSCASGAMLRDKGGVRRPPFLIDASSQVEGYAFLTSASEDEAAQETDRLKASFFTHFLVSGLRGAADLSQDGRVTLNEAYQFAFQETLQGTERSAHGPQHPAYDIRMSGTGDLVMTDLRQNSAGLVLASELDGRAYIRDDAGSLVAELYKPAGRPVELALPPGHYVVTLRQDQRFAALDLDISEGQRQTVEPGALSWQEGELAQARGDAEPAPAVRHTFLGTYLLPVPYPEPMAEDLSVGLLGVAPAAVSGVAFSAGVNIVARDLHGVSISGLGQTAGGDSVGLQVAPLFATAGGNLDGLVLSGGPLIAGGDARGLEMGLFSIVGGVTEGADVTGIFDITGGRMDGLQMAGVFALAGGDVQGMQVSGVFNGAPSVHGLQMAGVMNASKEIQGAQISGVANFADQGRGWQLGVVNMGGSFRGVQVGVVNIGDDTDVPIGLVNVIRHGYHSVEIGVSETAPANVDLKLGGRHFYNVLTFGLRPDGQALAGGGFGAHLTFGPRAHVDIEAAAQSLHEAPFTSEAPNLLARGRLQLGYRVVGPFTPFVGTSYNVWIPLDDEEQRPPLPAWMASNSQDSDSCSRCVEQWAGFQAGVGVVF